MRNTAYHACVVSVGIIIKIIFPDSDDAN